jgi:hypothetical protein
VYKLNLEQIAKYGRVVYETNQSSPNRVYIITQAHTIERDGQVEFYPKTPRIQAEIFRLASSLISNGDAELLLPEGMNFREDYTGLTSTLREPKQHWLKVPAAATDKGLEQNLGRLLPLGISADTLLIATFTDLNVQGTEDPRVHGLLPEMTEMVEAGTLPKGLFDYSISYRSGYFLATAPEVIEREFAAGRISKKSAIVTMGNGHLNEIMDYLKRGRIDLPPVRLGNKSYPGLQVTLNLTGLGYGVTIIKPLSIP